MRIRAMQREDCGTVATLSYDLGYPSGAQEIEKRFDAVIDGGDAAILVAEADDGNVIGWLHVHGRRLIESDPHAEIGGLVVSPSARRSGAGRMLVAGAESWAREQGYRVLTLRSNTSRTEARPFYERIGFKISKTQYKLTKELR
jgi:GNAT superfamily N-acetyltransferase